MSSITGEDLCSARHKQPIIHIQKLRMNNTRVNSVFKSTDKLLIIYVQLAKGIHQSFGQDWARTVSMSIIFLPDDDGLIQGYSDISPTCDV